jgi:hypothetical protein
MTTPLTLTAASARLHLDTAIALVGREQILAWIQEITPAPAPVPLVTATTIVRKTASCSAASTPKSGTRGRKAGILPTADQRCSWTLNNGDQCSNKRKGDNALCGLHIGKINLISPAVSVVGASSPALSVGAGADDDE